ncbi:18143_t:CDS:2, partial [Gigaspora rosea]
MDPDLKEYITSNKTKLINEILQFSKNVDDETLEFDPKQYYKNLYEKLLKNYSSLLEDIEKKSLIKKKDILFYKNELKSDTDECIRTYKSGSQPYYKMLYEKKQHDSNSLFRLLYDLKQREDNSYNIKEAKNEFERIKSP